MRIGLIAGGGQFPVLFSKEANARGYEVFAAAFIGEADEQLQDHVAGIEWMHLGQVRRLIRFFKKSRVPEAVMLGTIRKTRLFTDVRPDMKAISLVAAMRNTHDDGILTAFADLLDKEGIRIRASTFLLPELLAVPGVWTKRKPNRSEAGDMSLGFRLAKAIGRLDIGQCIVLGGGSVLAVEAIDGTDATIERGGRLANGHAVVVKVCKPNQDRRFDIPAVGIQTIRTMASAGATALAIEAGGAVVFDREEMISLADRHRIAIVALKEEENG